MSNHDHFPGQSKDVPVDHPYEGFPQDYALRSNLLVHRHVRDDKGEIIPGTTNPERGWTAIGTTVHKGVEYTRVGKLGDMTEDGRFPQRDIPTDELNRWQEAERQAREVAALGEQAVGTAAGEGPNWSAAEYSQRQDVPALNGQEPVYDKPIEDAITAEEARQLVEAAAAQNQADNANEAGHGYALERAKDEFVTAVARVVEEIDWAKKQTTVDPCYLCGQCAGSISQGLMPLRIARQDPTIKEELKRAVAILEEASGAGLNGDRYASHKAQGALGRAYSILDTMALSLF